MAYDESEDPDELLKYYDFGDLDTSSSATWVDNMNELVLENGTRVGHRRFLKHHRHVRKDTDDTKEDDAASIASLPRRERRHRLAITDGSSVEQRESRVEGIKAASAKRNFEQHVSVKHNMNTTLRARAQVPI
ncbi:hypothetical protein BJV82DRAFT_581624 [Fennellomyces sp. T-0311]|nr:hypothetical protein BJV82DRAFT_581624 [Fennellomyces sp. T-0311]